MFIYSTLLTLLARLVLQRNEVLATVPAKLLLTHFTQVSNTLATVT